jgi:hypothetical protein
MRKTLFAAAAVAALALPSAARAQASFGVAGRVGTLGLGGEADVKVTRFLGIRGGVGTIPIHPEADEGSIHYKIDPPKTIANVGVDVYPMGGSFRLSGGLFFRQEAKLTGVSTSTQTYTFNGQTYTASSVGAVIGTLEKASAKPYATLGFGRGSGHVGMLIEAGAAFTSEPKFTLAATGPLATDQSQVGTTFRANLKAEEAKAQTDINKYLKFHPIASVGIWIGI